MRNKTEFLIAFILLLSLLSLKAVIDHKINKYKKEMNNRVYINKDTLIVVDYNSFFQRFELSNGVEVNYNIVMKNKIK